MPTARWCWSSSSEGRLKSGVPANVCSDDECAGKGGFSRYIAVMRRDDVIAQLRQTKPALRALGVAGLYLFGSYARDEANSASDVDVFVDPASEDNFGFLPFMEVYEALRDAFDQRVEI